MIKLDGGIRRLFDVSPPTEIYSDVFSLSQFVMGVEDGCECERTTER